MTRDELDSLVQTHGDDLVRYLRYLGADPATAEDIAQDAFVGAYEARNAPPQTDGARCGAWLRAIARNQFFTYCRRRKRGPVDLTPAALQQAEDRWAATVPAADDGGGARYLDALRQCLQTLGERDRTLALARYEPAATRETLAETFGLQPEGIKTALRRIRERLADCVRRRVRREDRP